MLKVLDEEIGIKGGSWDETRNVEDVYTYKANIWCDTTMLVGPNATKRQCIAIDIERKGMPPKDGVRNELPPL